MSFAVSGFKLHFLFSQIYVYFEKILSLGALEAGIARKRRARRAMTGKVASYFFHQSVPSESLYSRRTRRALNALNSEPLS